MSYNNKSKNKEKIKLPSLLELLGTQGRKRIVFCLAGENELSMAEIRRRTKLNYVICNKHLAWLKKPI